MENTFTKPDVLPQTLTNFITPSIQFKEFHTVKPKLITKNLHDTLLLDQKHPRILANEKVYIVCFRLLNREKKNLIYHCLSYSPSFWESICNFFMEDWRLLSKTDNFDRDSFVVIHETEQKQGITNEKASLENLIRSADLKEWNKVNEILKTTTYSATTEDICDIINQIVDKRHYSLLNKIMVLVRNKIINYNGSLDIAPKSLATWLKVNSAGTLVNSLKESEIDFFNWNRLNNLYIVTKNKFQLLEQLKKSGFKDVNAGPQRTRGLVDGMYRQLALLDYFFLKALKKENEQQGKQLPAGKFTHKNISKLNGEYIEI